MFFLEEGELARVLDPLHEPQLVFQDAAVVQILEFLKKHSKIISLLNKRTPPG